MTAITYSIGLDVGLLRDYTAFVALERLIWVPGRKWVSLYELSDSEYKKYQLYAREWEGEAEGDPVYLVEDAFRYPRGTQVTEIVDDVAKRLFNDYPTKHTRLAVDVSASIGYPVYDLLKRKGLKPFGIHFTGGLSEALITNRYREYSVPKRTLAGVVAVLFESKRIRLYKDHPATELLTQEIANLQVRINDRGHDQYAADWENDTYDDLLFALACAAWIAEYSARYRGARAGTLDY